MGTAFLVGYGLFEIPSGHWGDRLGTRRVLTRIVLWWSLFTGLTGLVSAYPLLLLVRFLFGIGEAGSFPNASVAIAGWFRPESRGRALGLFMMCSQIGGALAPILVLPVQQAYGWRASFFLFGVLGVIWSAFWFSQFRDGPYAASSRTQVQMSWRPLLTHRGLWAIMALTFAYVYSMSFYQTWLHTYLAKGRGFGEGDLALSALPYGFGAFANLLGGLSCDWLLQRVGLRWSRSAVGVAGLVLSAAGLMSTIFVRGHLPIILCLSLAYAGITFQQPAVFSACLDIGGSRGGAVSGFMNTAGQLGGAISSAMFGLLVTRTGSYNAPLVPMTILLCLGACLWMLVNVTRPIMLTPTHSSDPLAAVELA